MRPGRNHRLVAGALVAVALVEAYAVGMATPPGNDERLYLAMARAIEAPDYEIPRRPTVDGSPFIGNPPLVVFVAATARRFVGDGLEALRVVHLLLFLTLFLGVTYALARRLFGPRAGLFALFLACLVEPLAIHGGHVRLDVPLAALGGLALLLGHAAVHGRRRRRAATIGSALALAAAVHVKYEAIFVPAALGLHGLWRSWRERRVDRRTAWLLAAQAAASGLVLLGWFAWIDAADAGLERFGEVGAKHLGPASLAELWDGFERPLRRFVLFAGLPVVGLAVVTLGARRGRAVASSRSLAFPIAWIGAAIVLQVLVDRGAERHLVKALPPLLALASGVPMLAVPLRQRRAERWVVGALPVLAALAGAALLLVWWSTGVVVAAIGAATVGLVFVARCGSVAARLVRRGAVASLGALAGFAAVQHLAAPNLTARFGPMMRAEVARVSAVAVAAREWAGPDGVVAYPRAEYGYYDGGPYVLVAGGPPRVEELLGSVVRVVLVVVESEGSAAALAARGWTPVLTWPGGLRAFAP